MSEKKNATVNVPEDMGDIGDIGEMGDIGDIGEMGDISDIKEEKGKSNNPKQSELTMEYVLGKIEEIANDTFHIHEAIDAISQIKSTGPGDVGTQEQTKAIGDIVKARETTNQRLIAFYEKLYDDLSPQDIKLKALETLGEFAKNTNLDTHSAAQLADIFGYIRHLK